MNTESLPQGLTIRPAVMDDVGGVTDLLTAVAMKMIGEQEETLDDMQRAWTAPHFDLAHSARVAVDETGRIVAYAVVVDVERMETPFVDVYLHPDRWEHDTVTDAILLEWAEARARESLDRVSPEIRIAIRGYSYSHDQRYLDALAKAGLHPIRQSHAMEINLSETPEVPPLPEGITLKVATRDDDWREVLHAIRDSWRDHFGNVERPFDEQWEHWYARWDQEFEPGCWLLAMDGDTVAGFCLCRAHFNDDPTYGWVSTLGTRRAYRRRGIALSLLKQGFATLYGMGRTCVGLGVDGSSLTGATHLYEKAGMHIDVSYTLVEKELRPGIDPTTTQLAEA